ncbi:hypothetical protein KFK09_006366 [Dendrobium nobile]|uniref:SWIM-type domain-containing protein n=1 Tax=Dendrobium nobile TaxID=94219 RepID=A0A8T3BRF4_DENNO|nr:hypothetical protein KFK09_006366 [Dendrobium nobile]
MSSINLCYIVLKFGGYWSEVQGETRMKYIGGSQKTIKLQRDEISLVLLKQRVEALCHWIRGQPFDLHYHVIGTSPKNYMLVASDSDLVDMLSSSYDRNRFEITVAMKHYEVDMSQNIQTELNNQSNEMYQYCSNIGDYNDIIVDDVCDDLFVPQIDEANSLFVGSQFDDSQSFKQAVRSAAILKNYAIKIKASDKSRVIVTCAYRGCPWRIRASLCHDGHSFEVRKIESSHLCPGVNRAGNKQATTSWVAHEIMDIVKRNPDITPKDISNNLEATYGLSLPYMKIWRSRELARDVMFGSVDDNYMWVPTLRSELLNRNVGSHITYMCDSRSNAFKRFFVSFKVCIEGFINGCRHLIGVDACHLKSKYLGVLLSAHCLDGNNGLYTIAYAVAESESKKSWEWFMKNLLESLACDIENLAFISDMEKGLSEAIKLIFPNAEHRVCMRHLWKNIKKYFRCEDGNKLQNLVWTAANSYNLHDLQKKMEEIFKISPQVHSYLSSLSCKWSKATFSLHIKNHYNTNNMSESFNAWVEDARSKPVVDLIDMIRVKVMEQRSQRKIISASWRSQLVPHVEEYIRDITTRKVHYIIRQSTSSRAEIEGIHERHEVDIEMKFCSCGFWQISGLPCIHSAAFIGTTQHILWHTYVDDHYYLNRYKMTYDGAISTLPGKEMWAAVSDNVDHIPCKAELPIANQEQLQYDDLLLFAPNNTFAYIICKDEISIAIANQ